MTKIFLKRILFILIIFIFSLIISFRHAISVFYLFSGFLTGLLTISLILVLYQYAAAKLYLERNIINKIEEDDIMEIKAVVKNTGFLPALNFVVEDNLTCAVKNEAKKYTLIDYLGWKSSVNIEYKCLCPKRGKYILGPFVLYFFDIFGLFFIKKTFKVYSELYVYPKTFTIRKFPQLTKGILPWFGIETTHISGDDDEFFGIREYKEGDPINKIHWFSTARKNKLIVKQFQRQSYFRATIVFDLEKDKNYGEGKESVTEYMIKIAASISKYLVERNIAVEIIAHTGELVHLPTNKGPEHLEDIMRFLTLAQAESRVTLSEIFQEYHSYIPDNSSLIFIMLDSDWEYFPEILPLVKKSTSILPITLVSSSFTNSIEKPDILIERGERIARVFNFKPIILSRGDKLEGAFLR